MSKTQQTQVTQSQAASKTRKVEQTQKSDRNISQLLEAPETMRPEDVLAAQQQVGNQVVQRALDKDARRKSLTDEQGNLREDITRQIHQKRGGGSPLPDPVRKEAAQKLGRSFEDVRIHTDETADGLSRAISARAFTIGKDIFFKNGVFAPGTSAGRETIIHELTHVVQQGGKSGASGTLKLGAPDTAHEKEADRIGKKHAASFSAAPAGAVQRESEEDELQMQSAEEEELLQAQPVEEEELQMQGEEDELQMQGDDDLADDDFDAPVDAASDSDVDDDSLLMQDDDDLAEDTPAEAPEDLMMQSAEEDELMMQPDAGNVVQRAWEEDKVNGGWKKKPEIVSPQAPTTKKKGVGGKIDLANKRLGTDAPTQLPGVDQAKMKKAQVTKANLNKELLKKVGGQEKQITGKSMNSIFHLEARRKEKFDENFGKQNYQKEQAEKDQTAKAAKDKVVDDAKQKWLATLKDPKSSPEEIAKAKERLGTFHKDVGKKDFKAAKNERRSALEEAAKGGDDEAYEKWQAERKKTKGEKAKDFFKSAGKKAGSGLLSAGKWAGGKALGFAKGKLSEGVNHFLGIKDDDKDDDSAKAPNVNVTANVGGGGGEAMSLVKELMQENRKLQDELASLKKAS